MGAWAESAFDNDEAADWAGEFDILDAEDGLAAIREALEPVAAAAAGSHIDATAGVRAVAAAELVAFLRGEEGRRSPYNETALDWIKRAHPVADTALVSLARAAVERVRSEDSELAELWEDAGDGWQAVMAELAARLERAAGR